MTESTQVQPSDDMPRRSRPMQLVGERKTPETSTGTRTSPRTSPATYATSAADEASPANLYDDRASWKAGVLGAINVFALILAARMIVLVSVGGGILLTWRALDEPDLYRLIALGTYCVAVVVPTVFLAGRSK